MEKVEKSQLIWQIHILFEWRFGHVSPVNFQALMMKKLRYKYCKKRITTRKVMSMVMSEVVIRLLQYLYLQFSSVKLKNVLKKHFRNVVKIKHEFVKLVVIFCTFYKMWLCDSFSEYVRSRKCLRYRKLKSYQTKI